MNMIDFEVDSTHKSAGIAYRIQRAGAAHLLLIAMLHYIGFELR